MIGQQGMGESGLVEVTNTYSQARVFPVEVWGSGSTVKGAA